jgi:hypothetical protein
MKKYRSFDPLNLFVVLYTVCIRIETLKQPHSTHCTTTVNESIVNCFCFSCQSSIVPPPPPPPPPPLRHSLSLSSIVKPEITKS